VGHSVACAVLRGEPPTVFLAEDLDALHWTLATEVVARARDQHWPEPVRTEVRAALLAERWADAVLAWMDHADVVVDVYLSVEVASVGDRTVAAAELQFTPLFSSGP
jgi:hypothetical protein